MLRASCLTPEIKEFRCYEAKIEKNEKGQQLLGVEPRTVYIEDYEGWWLSGCHSSVEECWQLNPEISRVQLWAAAGLYFCLITSKFLYSGHVRNVRPEVTTIKNIIVYLVQIYKV